MSALLLLACTRPATPTPSGDLEFPHPSAYEEGTGHGAEALRVGTDRCLACHREGANAPSCASCHPTYPHDEGWLAGATHGAGLAGTAAATERAECQACHGAAGLTASACTACHGSYPHAEGWKAAGAHGAWALSRGSATASCGSCHGDDLAGTETAPSCTSCHAGYPHPQGWSEATAHGAADQVTCAACHGEVGSGGTSGVACARCHGSYPHPAGFESGHLAVASVVGEGVCLDCHETGDGTPGVPAACGATCHGGLP